MEEWERKAEFIMRSGTNSLTQVPIYRTIFYTKTNIQKSIHRKRSNSEETKILEEKYKQADSIKIRVE